MSQKDKVSIIRSDDFRSVDEELAVAMSKLDATNARIFDLLEGDSGESPAADVAGAEPVQLAAPGEAASEGNEAAKAQAKDAG